MYYEIDFTGNEIDFSNVLNSKPDRSTKPSIP